MTQVLSHGGGVEHVEPRQRVGQVQYAVSAALGKYHHRRLMNKLDVADRHIVSALGGLLFWDDVCVFGDSDSSHEMVLLVSASSR